MLEKLLEKLGLSEKDAKVYLATLELGQATVQEISKKAKVVRPTTYVILENLMSTGLVSTVTEGKKTKFVAENPQELANLLEEQKHQIEVRSKELDESMNQLQAIYNASGDKPIVRYYEGKDGLVALDRYGKIPTKSTQEVYSISSVGLLEKLFPARRAESVNERVKAKIPAKTIYTRPSGPFSKEEDQKALRNAIYLSDDKIDLDMTISIYDWGVKFFYLNESKPYGVLFEDQKIANNMKQFFDLAWRGAQQVSK